MESTYKINIQSRQLLVEMGQKDKNDAAVQLGKGSFIPAMTDLGGIIDVAASLRGAQNLLTDLIDNPANVKMLCK